MEVSPRVTRVRAAWRLGPYEDQGVPCPPYRDAQQAALSADASVAPAPVEEAAVVLPFDQDDSVEFLPLRLVHVHHGDRMGFGWAPVYQLVGEDAPHCVSRAWVRGRPQAAAAPVRLAAPAARRAEAPARVVMQAPCFGWGVLSGCARRWRWPGGTPQAAAGGVDEDGGDRGGHRGHRPHRADQFAGGERDADAVEGERQRHVLLDPPVGAALMPRAVSSRCRSSRTMMMSASLLASMTLTCAQRSWRTLRPLKGAARVAAAALCNECCLGVPC
jgi:hypothetical protein